ncbi:MAG: hypothetical protein QF816_05400, partial [Candidatus Scalindua sp.]|nr:hypothetical protein [Candidatus Scalindua sp.]
NLSYFLLVTLGLIFSIEIFAEFIIGVIKKVNLVIYFAFCFVIYTNTQINQEIFHCTLGLNH